MKSSANKIQMTSFQDLFQAGNGVEVNGERVQDIPLSDLFPFKDHPFQVRDDEAMQETADSIAKYGVLVPGIVRPRLEGGYEIVAGHRRKRGSELAGKDTMPVIVRSLDNDEATVLAGDIAAQHIAVAVLYSELDAGNRFARHGIQLSEGQTAQGGIQEGQGLRIQRVDRDGLGLGTLVNDIAG
ncbi:MAG: ParB/RepB/Spo0J family partition protein, partial [Oscillospiraceae bacterium]|nr:ParB/RepB/Spo0J family partition protein [Oscillospiraceae bacterium]